MEFSYWWIPYAVGRFYLATENRRNGLAWCVLAGAILYLPPTVFEIIRGPTLAKWVTGQEYAGMLSGADRGVTFRPSVFLSSGFVLTMFYVWAVLIALHYSSRSFWHWFSPSREGDSFNSQSNIGVWNGVLSAIYVAVVVVCKSFGSIVLMGVGTCVLISARSRVAGVALATLCLLPICYIGLRTSGIATTDRIDTVVSRVLPKDRAASLKYRLKAEDIVFESMQNKVWWGYGDWGRWSVGRKSMILDGFWLFAWTRTGMVSVTAWLAMVGLPILIVAVFAIRSGWEVTQDVGFPCALFLALSLIDSMFNYFGEAPVMVCVGLVTAWSIELMSNRRDALSI
ncbi:hypothetical protein SH467x_004151 [Pirellulaceae bacterium SH467]